jgi:hypothetical protein
MERLERIKSENQSFNTSPKRHDGLISFAQLGELFEAPIDMKAVGEYMDRVNEIAFETHSERAAAICEGCLKIEMALVISKLDEALRKCAATQLTTVTNKN